VRVLMWPPNAKLPRSAPAVCTERSLPQRPQLTLRHRHARFDWSHDHLGLTIRTWRRVHWSDESRFLLRPTDGRARVWRQRNTSFQDNHILKSHTCSIGFMSGDIAGHGIV
jgi:hypothetical protein